MKVGARRGRPPRLGAGRPNRSDAAYFIIPGIVVLTSLVATILVFALFHH
ncbi:MAG TPA: hypothetical protein VJQ85_02060 [Gaiellaceae bacterium]|nr:hypothetical protein [Gaiellaceae bacterium]